MYADVLREHLGLSDELRVPIVELLDVLSVQLDDFNYEIVSDSELSANTHADTDIRTGLVRIKESVYKRACDGEGRDRMTIAHEIGHYFLFRICELKLERNFGEDDVPAFKDPEWQAKCFAGEFMISKRLTKGMSPSEIATACGVSLDAAEIQSKCK